MNALPLHPNDSKWLRGWLLSNLRFSIAALLLLIAVGHLPEIPITPGHAAIFETAIDPSTELPPETELVLLKARRPHPVAPQGWRRTSAGWEHVSTWTSLRKSINQLIATQQNREPAWIRFTFAKIRSVPPLMVALLQVTAITVIVNVARSRQVVNRDLTIH